MARTARAEHPPNPRDEPRRLRSGRRRRGRRQRRPGRRGPGGRRGQRGRRGQERAGSNRYPECGTVSHPIDVVTGRVFTHAIPICDLPGPLPLVWERSYSSAMADRDAGLGHGWGHSLGWELEVRSHRVRVWTGLGTAVDLPKPAEGEAVLGKCWPTSSRQCRRCESVKLPHLCATSASDIRRPQFTPGASGAGAAGLQPWLDSGQHNRFDSVKGAN
ncbi:DUF6531 domain-containing protein [Sorangium sp. So ce362]|uniref:DUF6531 domain-containing protein n=1 Tax=Sorangium sp. So ce362 TaxID=3133303 RepID=UPI003F60997C